MVKKILKDIKTNVNIAAMLITFFIIIFSIYVMLCGMQLYDQAEKFLKEITDEFNSF